MASEKNSVWPWLVGGAGVLAVVVLLARRPAAAARGPVEGDGYHGGGLQERDAAQDAALRAAAALKEAADRGAVAVPGDGALVRDAAREARVLAALGLTREAWEALDEATQRAKAVELLVALASFDRTDASAAVARWARGDILASLVPVAARDSAGIAHPAVALAATVRGGV